MKAINPKGARFSELAKPRGLKAEIARALNIDPPVVNNWRTRGVPATYAHAVAEILKCSPDEISDVVVAQHVAETAGQYDAAAFDMLPHDLLRRPARRTPVVGTAQLGDGGYWAEIDYPVGHGDGYVDAPSADPGAYALRVRGDSMAPAIRNGWIVLVEPSRETHPGELVVVCLKDGRCMVKEFLYERNGEITLGSVNQDHKPITVDRIDITRLHHVGAIIPPSKWQPV